MNDNKPEIFEQIECALIELGFVFKAHMLRGFLFVGSDSTAIAVDHMICNRSTPFTYSAYTAEQNQLMASYDRFFRFVVDTDEDIVSLKSSISFLLNRTFEDGDLEQVAGGDRQVQAIDPTAPEAYFEQAFIDCYGRNYLESVTREYPIIDIEGRSRFVDYYIDTIHGGIAIEKNGELYHHPLLTGRSRYLGQLLKQNSLVAYGIKVFRWSLESMQFSDQFREELKLYLGGSERFLLAQKVSVNRSFALYDHQENALEKMQLARQNGERAALLVFPTGTGKTEILIADLVSMFKKSPVEFSGLVLVPTIQLKKQAIEAFNRGVSRYGITAEEFASERRGLTVLVQTYAWMIRNIHSFGAEEFDYIAIDEAHHVMAPALKKVIHKFNPGFMLGLTATDKRLDAAMLEDIFGKYETDLSLVEAIKHGLLAPIRAFRLKSNIDLSEIRYNGRDYVNADLERSVVVDSRNQLIVNVLKKYFFDSSLDKKSGIVFCVSVRHAQKMAEMMNSQGLSAVSVSGMDKDSNDKIEKYQNGEIQFITTCSLLNEGWDLPRTSVIVMARPTMSKVLYTQQIGRGTRRYPGKEALYIIDVVDSYGSLGAFRNVPWSIHALLGFQQYRPWANVIDCAAPCGSEELILAGLYEYERAIEEIDIFTFEYKYPDHLSDEQLARELFVSTDTVKSWVKNEKIFPAVTVPFGKRRLNYYAPTQVDNIRSSLGLKVHDESTQYDDFFAFLEERDYSMSYKMILLLSIFRIVDEHGESCLDELTREYTAFYKSRLAANLMVDKTSCPYTLETLDDQKFVKQSILINPFEKFERKRFMYQCKDLNKIAFSALLWARLEKNGDISRIKKQIFQDLQNYYQKYDGIPDLSNWSDYWRI